MSAERKFLVPRSGVLVRDPRTKEILPEGGDYKDWIGTEGRYWRRRVNDGDVIMYEDRPVTEAKYDRKKFENKEVVK